VPPGASLPWRVSLLCRWRSRVPRAILVASEAADAAYGATEHRLRAVKSVYDPDNVLPPNQNVTPLEAS
jgi:FAD/FMN-containing dehydrogenase